MSRYVPFFNAFLTHRGTALFLLLVAWAMSGIVLADVGPPTIASDLSVCRFIVDEDGTRTDPLPCGDIPWNQERTTTWSGYQAWGSISTTCIQVDGECYDPPTSYTVYTGVTTGPCFYLAPDGNQYFTTNVIAILQPSANTDDVLLALSCAGLQPLPF